MEMDSLQEQLSYKFRNPELLEQALTYSTLQTPTSSPFNSQKRTCDHLKILGDSVIKLLTSQYAICISPPNETVHKIHRVKENLCNRYCQNLIGKSLKLDEKRLVKTNLNPDQICSHLDTFVKSLFGAIFLDSGGSQKKGFVSCWKVFLKLWRPLIASYDGAKPLIACFPEPKYSSQEFFKERFNNFKHVDLKLLEEKIGFKFLKHPYLLEASMTHDSIDNFRSVVDNPNPELPEFVHFQTLEFLGDSVLELIIMEYLYLRSSSADPLGKLLFFNKDTGSKLVSARFQIQVAKKLKLEDFVIKPPQIGLTNYDDFVESLIGSIYIHAKAIGLRACAKVVLEEMWGLEPALEEELEEQRIKNKEESVNVRENVADKKITGGNGNALPATPSTSTASVTAKPAAHSPSLHKELQTVLDYKFLNTSLLNYLPAKIDVGTSDASANSMNTITVSRNLQEIGKRALALIVAEYVTKICHSSRTADLSAKTKTSFHKLMQSLSSDEIMKEIFERIKLAKFFNIHEHKIPNPTTSASDVMYLIFGTIFIDSSGSPEKLQKVFLKLWQNYFNGAKPEPSLINCFPDTSEKQQVFRSTANAKITDAMWNKMFQLIGHTFAHKNLLEQALTDEKSLGYAKQCHDAYPLGNPFGLQILGRCVIDLFLAQRCYFNTLAEPGNFTVVLQRMDHGFFNTLKSRFHYLERYYVKQFKQPFPPKKNPRAPYEAMFAALYIDVGGGLKGMQQIYVAVAKGCPTLLEMKKPKQVKPPAVMDESAVGASESPVSTGAGKDASPALMGSGKKCGVERRLGNSESSDSPMDSPLMKSQKFSEQLGSFGSKSSSSQQQAAVLAGNITQQLPPTIIPAEAQDALFSELQTKLDYKFVNPLLLKIVLEVDIPIREAGDDSPISSKNHFEIFKILGKRALNLLTTEAALQSVLRKFPNAEILDHCKMQVQGYRDELASPNLMAIISRHLDLKKYTYSSRNGTILTNEEFFTALFGAVFIDSRANYMRIWALFNKLWKINVNSVQNPPSVGNCFPLTAEGQTKLRTATGTVVKESDWKKFYKKLGYTFKNRNLLEQALTEESSQKMANVKHGPTGNPFGLRLLGRCVLELVIAYKVLPATLNALVTNYYVDTLYSTEKALFNSFTNNFLGTHKYFACLKPKKSQQFPPKDNPAGPFEAVLGAAFVDAGAGNPGLDTVGLIIIQRNIGFKGSKPNIAIFNATPVQMNAKLEPISDPESIPVPLSCSTPTPSTSSGHSESLNASFSSKCAANFWISPAQLKNSPPKPRQASASDFTVVESDFSSVSSLKETQMAASSTNSPKETQKDEPQQTSYASVLINGVHVQTDNRLIIALTNATSQIQALKKEQEAIDRCRKLSMEKGKMQQGQPQQEEDQVSNASSRSRCPSMSTITSVGSRHNHQQLGASANGKKVKRGGRGGKKRNKKPTEVAQSQPPATPPEQLLVTPQKTNSERVSAWCQNQMDNRMPPPSSSSSTILSSGSSSCTTEVHPQRSMVHQPQNSCPREADVGEDFPSPNHSVYNTHVPVNMVSGYRKSVVADYGYGDDNDCKKTGHEQCSSSSAANGNVATPPEDPGSGISLLGVLKWTSLILGVAFLLKRYSQGK